MAAVTESMPHSPFTSKPGIHKTVPILSSSSPLSRSVASTSVQDIQTMPAMAAPEPMDVSPTSKMGPPPAVHSPNEKDTSPNGDSEHTNGGTGISAAAAASQPKVVQTAFIHKLYNMLEDRSIHHLISWSNNNESFVISPSTEFAKVLSSYFKHTNISSFVRQLNMYGFHKVSDVFQSGQPDSPLWEFKHGNGSFKRGDLVGLREIKRRASRHALIHRDSFSAASAAPKPAMPPTVETPMDTMPHTLEGRLSVLEHNYFDMHARLARSEDQTTYLTTKCVTLMEGLTRCHQWNQDLATYVMALVPEHDKQMQSNVAMMQREIARQSDLLRSVDEPISAPPVSARDPYFATLHDHATPLSPRQMPQMDRRPSQPSLLGDRASFRPPPHLAISPRRYGSIGSNSSFSPSSARPATQNLPPPPPPPSATSQHPLATAAAQSPPPYMNLARRHTSADIRINGWENGIPPTVSPEEPTRTPAQRSPYASGHNSTQWPSSPARNPFSMSNGHREGDDLREQLGSYDMRRASQRPPISPGLAPGDAGANAGPEAAWQLPGAKFSPFKSQNYDPFSRRGSMQSNVHSLLNPAAGGDDDEVGPDGERKRKRMQ